MLGLDTAKKILNSGLTFNDFLSAAINTPSGFEHIDGVGEEKTKAIELWFKDINDQNIVNNFIF